MNYTEENVTEIAEMQNIERIFHKGRLRKLFG